MYVDSDFDKQFIDKCLNELALEYKKFSNKPVKLIIVGGASVLLNYNFRKSTGDIDVTAITSSIIKDAVKNIGKKYGIHHQWLNDDMKNTASFSKILDKISKPYNIFSGILEVRNISDEYLVAMKLMAGRIYKYDMSDIIGIISEHKKIGDEITYQKIDNAICTLYGSWENIPENSKIFVDLIYKNNDYDNLYKKIRDEEEINYFEKEKAEISLINEGEE